MWLLIGFIAFFAFSQGAVIWVYLGEVFPTSVRANGQSLGSFSHWVMNAAISFAFPVLGASSRWPPLRFLRGDDGVAVLGRVIYPETKGVTLEEMQRHLGIE